MVGERANKPDPLQIINVDRRKRRQIIRPLKTVLPISVTTGIAVSVSELLGVPKTLQVDLGLMAVGGAYYAQDTARTLFSGLRNLPPLEQVEDAIKRIKLVGKKPSSVKEVMDTKGGFSEEFGTYMLASRIRATKLYLARAGKLEEYEKGKWLNSVPIPRWLKPTQEDVDEVVEWWEGQKERRNRFVAEVAKLEGINIEIGDETMPTTTRVYLFHDKNNLWDHESMPLIDVMQGFAATRDELRKVFTFEHVMKLFDQRYEGLYSQKGKQRIADFFGKPVVFYMGAQVGWGNANKYGVLEPEVMTVNTIVEAAAGLRHEPFSWMESFQPSKARMKALGLELATA